MNNIDFLGDMYNDFFGIEKLQGKTKNKQLSNDFPKIELQKDNEQKEIQTEDQLRKMKDEKMSIFFEDIEKLYITQESKNMLKKIVEYLRKYNEGIEKQYISFNMCIYADSKETICKIVNILNETFHFFQYIGGKKSVKISLYDVEKADQIEEIYKPEYGVILLKDFEGFIAQEQNFKNKFLHKLEEKVTENSKNYLTILTAKNKEIIERAFDGNIEIKEKVFNFEITSVKPDVQEMYQDVLEKLKENSKLDDAFEIDLLDYVSTTYPNTNLSYPEYRDKLCDKILFSKNDIIRKSDLPEYVKEKTIKEIFEELNGLVGLENVKQVLQDLVSLIELKNKTGDYLKIKDTNLHMVFLGNPGTGKTTVARMISQILYNLKYVRQNKLIEVSSKDLVAEYVGQTAPKTMAVIEKAIGGVLFIDEAYSLVSGNGSQGNSFNEEAIATLIQAMENYRDNLVVIFAGYTKEMQAFLNANSGIVSRIGYTLEFEDYTENQLIEIFKSMIRKSGFSVTKEALEKVREIILEFKKSENFGNARFVRNLYEKTVIKHASNTKNIKNRKILKTITADDINVENLLKG